MEVEKIDVPEYTTPSEAMDNSLISYVSEDGHNQKINDNESVTDSNSLTNLDTNELDKASASLSQKNG